MGVPRMTVTYTLQIPLNRPENGVLVPCPLLVVGGPDHGHHNAEENAQCQRHGRDQQGGADAVQVLLPAASFDKCLIEFDVEFLPEGCGAVPHQGFPKFVKFHSFTFSFNIARYRVIRRKSAFPARRSVFRVQPCQGRLEPPLAKRLDYSAEMYLSTMDWTVPSAVSSASAWLTGIQQSGVVLVHADGVAPR